jgi:hypothetical protein
MPTIGSGPGEDRCRESAGGPVALNNVHSSSRNDLTRAMLALTRFVKY